MPHRAGSPAVSENEFDITNSLFKNDVDAEDDDFGFPTNKDLGNLDTGGILDLGVESDGEGDEEFIAAQQAASNRKSSNVKGKSVKKGGGFQALGTNSPNISWREITNWAKG
jgi:ATP-dependent RNA helicase DDX54/DBP10